MTGIGADADDGLDAQLFHQVFLNGPGGFQDLIRAVGGRQGLDHHDIRFVDVQHEVLLLVHKQPLHQLHRRHIRVLHLAHQQHYPGLIGDEMQLLGPHIHIAGQDVVGNDVLYEGSLVVLLLVIVLGLVESHRRNGADGAAHGIAALGEGRVVQLGAGRGQRAENPASGDDRLFSPFKIGKVEILQPGTDHGKLTAGHHKALLVHHAKGPVYTVFHLDNHVLENPAGHNFSLLYFWCIPRSTMVKLPYGQISLFTF